MSQVINTNVGSLFAGAALNKSALALQTAQQRLSSGLRINSAKDDATGLALATGIDSQVRAANIQVRNANDAVSLAQTNDGYLGQINDNLQRLYEIATQTGATTNVEATALIKENTRLSVLVQNDGAVQVDQIGGTAGGVGQKVTTATAYAGTGGSPVAVGAGATTPGAVAGAVAGTLAAGTLIANITTGTATRAISIGAVALGNNAVTNGQAIASAINTALSLAPGGAAVNGTAIADVTGFVTITAGSSPITLSMGGSAADAATAITNRATLAAQTGFTTAQLGSQAVAGVSVADAVSADIAAVAAGRAGYGADMATLASAVANLQVTSVNLSASYSRIMDTDYAAETTNMTRNNILQQAGTAVLAQANQTPNTVLTLLR